MTACRSLVRSTTAGRVRDALDPAAGALLLIGAAHQRAMHRYLLGAAAMRFLPPVGTVVGALLPAFEPLPATKSSGAPRVELLCRVLAVVKKLCERSC
jgi:hypothetical protein